MITSEEILLLNCIGIWVNLGINDEILKTIKNKNDTKILLQILEQLKQLNRRLENGRNNKL